MTLSLQPPRGTQDRFPEEYAIRKHIFDTRRKICLSFGYEEYLGPLVEPADIRRAKSGEDVGGPELTLITDRERNISDLAIRPEMTPTVTRMVANKYRQLAKPIRRFSIANFYRNERPQRGRNREFRQLNVDMFGEVSLLAEVEILQTSLELMLAFGAPQDSFVLKINHRHLIDQFLLDIVKITPEQKKQVVRLMDKREKIGQESFLQATNELDCTLPQAEQMIQFLNTTSLEELLAVFPSLGKESALQEIQYVVQLLADLGYGDRITFSPALMRGFDYYDGIVFEVFDNHPNNNRAMFGGGRYNGLAEIFGSKEQIPAVWYAPGDEPMRLFLESRGLIETIHNEAADTVYLPLLDESLTHDLLQLAHELRRNGTAVEVGLAVKKLPKALEYADKRGYTKVIIFGTEEQQQGIRKVKDLKTSDEQRADTIPAMIVLLKA